MYDVIVIGSGGAGLSAALAAAVGGVHVLVLEASSRWGGSTAVSAGEVWTPANHRMAELGVKDSIKDAQRYCHPHAIGRRPELVDAFVHAAPQMAKFVEANSPIDWHAMTSPDSFAERPGGRSSARHLEVSPLAVGEIAPLEDDFWLSTHPSIFTNDEVFKLRLLLGGEIPAKLAQDRMNAGLICTGIGLVVGLMQGCRALGVEFERNVRARRLLREAGDDVNGVVVERDGVEDTIYANRGVVLATGGFEWDKALRETMLSSPVTHPVSPPLHYGDGLRMTTEVGGALAHTSESWCWPAHEVTDQYWPDSQTPQHSLILAERCLPHVIWVNQAGLRFVNESSHNCALALKSPDVPAWAVADRHFRSRYPLAGQAPGAELPAHVIEAPSLDALARATGIDEQGLKQTIKRFNGMVAGGRDDDFQRGETAYDRYYGDPTAVHPNLGSIEQGPFYAMPVHAGAVGTKGGALTDENARVLDEQDRPIGGLWAAGNAMASIIGPGTIAPGLTLGLALTWGYLAGQDAGKGATQN